MEEMALLEAVAGSEEAVLAAEILAEPAGLVAVAVVAVVASTDKEETADMAVMVTEAVTMESGSVDKEVEGMVPKAADTAQD